MKLILNPQYNLYQHDNRVLCDSLQVAEIFEKEHKNVIRDIENLECSAEFNRLNFERSAYKDDSGKKNKRYLMTKDGFIFLVMGYRGKKAARFKEAYINRFNEMEYLIKAQISAKMEFPAFTEAIMLAHENPKPYHYTNEVNMIYRIVLGVNAKTYRSQNGICDNESIRSYLSTEQIQAVEVLQRIDIGLIEAGLDYESRKAVLSNRYQRMQLRLSA